MSAVRKDQIYKFLTDLVGQFETLEDERQYLVNNAQARVVAIQAEKAELAIEAQEQLDKLNVMRVADGLDPLTLQEIRAIVNRRKNRG